MPCDNIVKLLYFDSEFGHFCLTQIDIFVYFVKFKKELQEIISINRCIFSKKSP